MRILYYSSHPNLNLASPSGYGTHMREMIQAFTELGHEVKPVIMGGTTMEDSNFQIQRRGRLKGLAAMAVPPYVWETAKDLKLLQFDKYAKKALEKEIEAFQPDFIYERAAYLQTSGVTAARNKGVKHVLEVNSPYVEERKFLQGNSYFVRKGVEAEQQQLAYTNKVVVVSSALEKHFTKAYDLSSDKFLITPNAINPQFLSATTGNAATLKSELKLSDKLIIGFVGSIFPWHGIDLLIDAVDSVLKRGIGNAHLLIVGDGETLPLLKQRAAVRGLAGKVTFTGNVAHKKVPDYIDMMDICVMAKSNWYGSPVKIFEYGALGKAIVAPNTAPMKDVMVDKETGLLVEPTVESVAEALLTYCSNTSLRVSCSETFRLKVLAEHTWIKNAQKVLQAIS